VIVKGQTVLIRKTTAIWLFQETEYVSADRIFRVRFKQPCASINESKETVSDEKAAIKEAHVDDEMSSSMTSSTDCHDQDSAIDRKTTESTKVVVDLPSACDSELLQKSDDCGEQEGPKDNKITLGTPIVDDLESCGQSEGVCATNHLRSDMMAVDTSKLNNSDLNQQAGVAINKTDKLSGLVSSFMKSDDVSDKATHEVIVIDDEVNRSINSAKPVKICKISETWLKIGSFVLCKAERSMLCNNEWLTDLHINAVQVLLQQQFPHIGGLQNTVLLQSKSYVKPFQHGLRSLQIIHVNNNHWVVASTMNCEKADITIYDSLYSVVTTDTQVLIASLLNTQEDSFKIQMPKVNKQSGTRDCGVFAAAYCTALAFGEDPSAVVYNQKHLRHHLLSCLEAKEMSVFPTIRPRRTASILFTVNVYCNCRGPDTGEAMVACDKCKKWYHAECINGCLKDFKSKQMVLLELCWIIRNFYLIHLCTVFMCASSILHKLYS